ncbi:metallophosphoesterase [Isosphaeraceae bacterium EP7]
MTIERRKFFKGAAASLLGLGLAGGAYPFLEARWCRVTRVRVPLRNLPAAFEGTTLAHLTDIHHGPNVSIEYVRHVVDMTNALKPDLVMLTGDFVHRGHPHIEPVAGELARLRAGMGKFAVLGNHDHWGNPADMRAALVSAGVTLAENRGEWIERGCNRLRVAGVGDLWEDRQDPASALGDADEGDATILMSHNPDYAEYLTDRRVGLMLSGHTHGGQIRVPGYGAPILPSRFGQKYAQGLVEGPACPVYVSRGVGTAGPPARFFCRPEVVHITLTSSA